MNTKLPTSQESIQPGQPLADLITDIHDLTGKLDMFALSSMLAWRKHPHHRRQHFQTTPPERSTP